MGLYSSSGMVCVLRNMQVCANPIMMTRKIQDKPIKCINIWNINTSNNLKAEIELTEKQWLTYDQTLQIKFYNSMSDNR